MARQNLGKGCPPSPFGDEMSQEMDFEMGSPGAYLGPQHSQHASYDYTTFNDQQFYGDLPVLLQPTNDDQCAMASAAYAFRPAEHLPAGGFQYTVQHIHQRHQSSSTQSSHSSFPRSSAGSGFSQWDPRNSVASTNTTYSQLSDFSRDQHIAQAGRALDPRFSATSPTPFTSIEEPVISSPAPRRVAHRQSPQERNPFQSCRSGTRRVQQKQKEPTHWCTSCGKGFGEKYDWKRHEETFQERFEMFECGLCDNVYFLDKDFIHHHQTSHRCQICRQKQHVDSARKMRKARTGWGCGFCTHFSSDWKERCDHISLHFERCTIEKWHHSQVIISLLQRPEIAFEWDLLVRDKQQTLKFGWNSSSTGRVEGFPDVNFQPQLQDLLEFFTHDQDAAAIARLAFDKGLRKKELPQTPAPPPVPEKDHRSRPAIQPVPYHTVQHHPQHLKTLHENINDNMFWNQMPDTIPEDVMPPSNVTTLDYDTRHAAFRHMPENFHSFH